MTEREPWFHRVKAAQRDLIARCGGIERAAEVGEVAVSQMGRFNNVGADDLMGARVKSRLEAYAGDPVVSRVECEWLGWKVEPAGLSPELLSGSKADHHARLMKPIVEAGDATRAYLDGMKDGEFSPADCAAYDKELSELADAVQQARLANAALRGRVS
jgi:hypothetical protein